MKNDRFVQQSTVQYSVPRDESVSIFMKCVNSEDRLRWQSQSNGTVKLQNIGIQRIMTKRSKSKIINVQLKIRLQGNRDI